jgi:hypothetical protein
MKIKSISTALSRTEQNANVKKKIEQSIIVWQILVWVTALLKIVNYSDGYLFVYDSDPSTDWSIYTVVASIIELVNVVDVFLIHLIFLIFFIHKLNCQTFFFLLFLKQIELLTIIGSGRQKKQQSVTKLSTIPPMSAPSELLE